MTRGRPFTPTDSRRGRGPVKGAKNAGRKPDAFKALCAKITSSDEAIRAARAILEDRSHPAWASVFKTLAAYAYGPQTQHVSVSANVHSPVVLLPVRER